MKKIRIICVGKAKIPHWKHAMDHYIKRLSHSVDIDFITVKDAESKLPKDIGIQQEGERVLKQVNTSDIVICMDETGKSMSSRQLATYLTQLYDYGKVPCFCIGGAYGHAPSVKERANFLLSLSAMTYPHELAQVVLFEQLYRTETIIAGTGYHH